MSASDYRPQFYEHYGSRFQDLGPEFDAPAVRRWGKAYDYYLRRWLPADKSSPIAEIACGGGRFLFFLKERGYLNIQAVDISPEQVALARHVLPGVQQGDAVEFLKKHPDSFELVVGLDFVEHLEKAEFFQFLRAVDGALHMGGRLILQMPNAGSPFFGEARYGDISHEICFSVNSIRRLLFSQGFREVEIRETGPVPMGYSLASSIRFMGWRLMRTSIKLWHLVETGSSGDGVVTRDLIVSARKVCRT